jgi:hypothetical protein
MKNDAKLGMLVGVLGVIVSAVLFANTPRPGPAGDPNPKAATPAAATATAAPTTPPVAQTAARSSGSTALPTTPVVRTRKETEAQPASRTGGADEEP